MTNRPNRPNRPGRPRQRAAGWLAALLAIGGAACTGEIDAEDAAPETTKMSPDAPYQTSTDAWHASRLDRLTASDGWLTLVGLTWLDEGPNDVGRGPNAAVRYDGFPVDRVGTIVRAGEALRFEIEPGAPVTGASPDGVLHADDAETPTILTIGTCRFHVIRRGGRYGVRIKDEAAEARRAFTGVERFPVDPAWRVSARWTPAAPDTVTPVDLIIGTTIEEAVAGRAEFVRDGVTASMVLTPTSDPDRFFVVFGDATNGETTYGGGRFLEATREGDVVILDFNRAYNPPCAFTPYATCPLPVADNRLPFAVLAGEQRAGAH